MKTQTVIVFSIAITAIFSSCGQPVTKTLTNEQLRDKIAGAWAGKMIGVSYGARTEFKAQGQTYEKELPWRAEMVENALRQDDLYVQLSFMMAMDDFGLDAPAEKFAEYIAKAKFRLAHANYQARKNYFDGIMPPKSGSPEYNLHADDIDFQIDADFIGFMCPGMPQTSNRIADKIGHIMNYGDGVYGGMFVAALHTQAFFENDIPTIIERALLSIPAESDYAKCVNDAIIFHRKYPTDWRASWAELERKWGPTDLCIKGSLFQYNIDAKINGAYIVLGLLYGNGDFAKTMEISLRYGQDSDCNPSNAAAVLGIVKGLRGIPEKWKSGIEALVDSVIIHTNYTFNLAVANTVNYAKNLITENGGTVTNSDVTINIQEPTPPGLEVSFPNVAAVYRSNVLDGTGWSRKGNWKVFSGSNYYLFGKTGEVGISSNERESELNFTFEGTGVAIAGPAGPFGGKADIFVDDKFHRNINTYHRREIANYYAIWHVMNLKPGKHTVRIVVTGEKKPEAKDSRIQITGATVYTTIKI